MRHSSDEESPLVYAEQKRYRQWYIRNGKIFKLETDSMLYPLQDGDIIELGRTVLLKFEVIE